MTESIGARLQRANDKVAREIARPEDRMHLVVQRLHDDLEASRPRSITEQLEAVSTLLTAIDHVTMTAENSSQMRTSIRRLVAEAQLLI